MENIQVALRVRPLNLKEALLQDRNHFHISEKSEAISIYPKTIPELANYKRIPIKQSYCFTFDHCFSEEVPNQKIYEKTVRKIVASSLLGINGTVFMYGQTGAGKTYTMLGPKKNDPEGSLSGINNVGKSMISEDLKENSGILIYALNDFFEQIQEVD